jgi:drug/metabolite transporter (DMT)-like permease
MNDKGKPPAASGTGRATAAGMAAVLLWSCLALLTTLTAGIPPFELLAFSFGIAFVLGSALLALGPRGARLAAWRQPWGAWVTGFLGLFGYHALYFFALKSAPAARASLIAYLWPLFLVLLSALAAGRRPGPRHLAGAALGLAGTAAIMLARGGPDAGAGAGAGADALAANAAAGYVAAFACALTWSGYSVLNRRYSHVPSGIVSGLCGLVALAGLACHLALEATVWPGLVQWLAIAGLGLGPVGAAFFAWDHASKHGNLAVLGALSYLAPLISTLLLILAGQADAGLFLLVPALLIIAGAVVATAPLKRGRG